MDIHKGISKVFHDSDISGTLCRLL